MTTDRDAVERLAPERIWTSPSASLGWRTGFCTDEQIDLASGDITEYIRADHSDAQLQAAVAEMREAFNRMDDFAVKIHDDDGNHYSVRARDFEAIWSIFKRPNPTAALERAIEAARRKGFIVGFMSSGEGYNGEYVGSRFNYDCQAVAEADADEWLSRARSDAQNKGA